MGGLNDIMGWVGSGFAIASAVFTLFMGIRYEKNIKRMDEKLKDFQLEEYRRKEEEEKKAILRAEVFHIGKEWKISIINEGRCQARNIRIMSNDLTSESGKIQIMNEPIIPYPILNRNDRFYLNLYLMEFHNIKPVIHLVWDDDYGTNRTITQSLCLC